MKRILIKFTRSEKETIEYKLKELGYVKFINQHDTLFINTNVENWAFCILKNKTFFLFKFVNLTYKSQEKAIDFDTFLKIHRFNEKFEIATGKKENTNKLSYADLPFLGLEEVAKVEKYGKSKYPRGNSSKTHNYTDLWDAAFRHLTKAIKNEDLDSESGEEHLAHAAWNILTMLELKKNGKLNDNRLT